MNKTIARFIVGLGVFAERYLENGEGEWYFCSAQHDIIYFFVDINDLPGNSDDGKRLIELGFYIDEDTMKWCWST